MDVRRICASSVCVFIGSTVPSVKVRNTMEQLGLLALICVARGTHYMQKSNKMYEKNSCDALYGQGCAHWFKPSFGRAANCDGSRLAWAIRESHGRMSIRRRFTNILREDLPVATRQLGLWEWGFLCLWNRQYTRYWQEMRKRPG